MSANRLGLIAAGMMFGAVVMAPLCGPAPLARAAPLFHPATRVVLFTPSPADPLVARLEAELAAVGIAVRRMPVPAESQLDALVTREIGAGASAAIRIIPRSRGTEVWTGDTTARVLSRPAARGPRGEVSDAVLSVIALRTVEFLRASLLDVKRRAGGNGAGVAGRGPADQQSGRETGTGSDRGIASAGGGAPGSGTVSTPALSGHPQASPGASAGAGASAATNGAGAGAGAGAGTGPGGGPAGTPANAASGPVTVEVFATRAPEAVAGTSASGGAPVNAFQTPAESFAPRPTEERPSAVSSANAPDQAAGPRAETTRPGARTPTIARRSFAGERRLEIAAGPAVLASLGGIAPIPSVAVVGGGSLSDRWGWEMMAVFPVIPAHVTNQSGSVEVSTSLFGAAGTFRLSAGGPWRADVALGLSALMVRTVGTGAGFFGSSANTGYTEAAWQACGHLRMGSGYQLNRWLAARVDLLAGLAAARTRIATLVIDDNRNQVTGAVPDFGTWGRAFGGAMAGIQATW